MFGQKYLTCALFLTLLAIATSAAIKDYGSPEARDIISDNALTQILPQYLNWFSNTQAPKPMSEIIKPIIIVQGERPGATYYGNNYWPYPAPVHHQQQQQHYGPNALFEPQPQRPHHQHRPNHHQQQNFDYYGGQHVGNYPAFIIINPTNLQSLTGPPQPPVTTTAAARTPTSNTHDTTHNEPLAPAELASITNILSNIENAETDTDTIMELDATKPALSDLTKAFTDNLDLAALDLTPEELEALRKNARTLTPKRLVALLMQQDNRRKRVEEAMAGIYLRNFNLNKK